MAAGVVLATTPATSEKAPRRGPRARGGMTKKRSVDWLLLALVIVGAIAVIAPFYLVLVNSFKSPVDYANGGPLALPQGTVAPTGRRMDAPCCDVFRLKDGKIQSFNCYPSGTVMLAQLGLLQISTVNQRNK